MHQLARGVLVVVALFVLLVAGTLIVRSRTARLETLEPTVTNADLRIKEVQIEEESGGVRWRLRAEQALIYEAEGRTTLRAIAVNVYERDRSWTIVGDEGDLFQQSRDVEVRRNVVLTSSDGVRLETSVLRWQGSEKRLWTDAPVTLARAGSVVRGTGLEVRMADETTTLAGRVRATFASERSR